MAKVPIGKAPFGAANIDLGDLPDFLISDSPMQYLIDKTTTADVTYFCEAPVGIATSAAGWRIAEYHRVNGTFRYADGNTNYDNIADNRASLTYSYTKL